MSIIAIIVQMATSNLYAAAVPAQGYPEGRSWEECGNPTPFLQSFKFLKSGFRQKKHPRVSAGVFLRSILSIPSPSMGGEG